MQYGAVLVKQRDRTDGRKRKFEDMSPTEQQCLEDYDTEKSINKYSEACMRKPSPFRGEMITSRATTTGKGNGKAWD